MALAVSSFNRDGGIPYRPRRSWRDSTIRPPRPATEGMLSVTTKNGEDRNAGNVTAQVVDALGPNLSPEAHPWRALRTRGLVRLVPQIYPQ